MRERVVCSSSHVDTRECITNGVKAIHHGGDHVQFGLYGLIDKVRVNDDPVGRTKGLIVLKKQTGGHLWATRVPRCAFSCLDSAPYMWCTASWRLASVFCFSSCLTWFFFLSRERHPFTCVTQSAHTYMRWSLALMIRFT